ncbi:MYND-type domain-containing protein [Mycena indigotica]|uniref:MYND-type domain-containing protein n=1 Tax=Mycena indigotica TaxID=2126181 RepID=A0A8H6SD57_9AGAR|nr:MYND-type domain-containing protein [Mycena indigotica]KAF7297350.1 MYND-type domain-containing protein [Mycena indigotica]
MAVGTDDVYKLDLNEIIAFPDSAHVPVLPPQPGESWIILAEIIQDVSAFRPVFLTRDKIGSEFIVAFYTDNPMGDVEAMKCRVGHVMCIRNGMRHRFFDGQSGYRIEDPTTTFMLPCSMAQLQQINSRLRQINDDGEMGKCIACKKQAELRCKKCQVRYCGQSCQAKDWKDGGHRKECAIIATLRLWNRTDWG